MVSLAHPVDIAMVRTPDDLQAFEHSSRLRVLFSSQILPKVCFTADEVHYSLLVGTASCRVFVMRFNLSEPLRGVQGKDLAEVTRSDIHASERRDCFSFELVGRDSRGMYICFGCAGRYLRLCFLSYAGEAEATAQDLKPFIGFSKAFTQFLKIEAAENVIRVQFCGSGNVITLCDSGLLCLWDLARKSVLCEAEAFSQRCSKAFLAILQGPETLIAVGYPEEKTWVVAIYHLQDRKFAHLMDVPGDLEELVSLAVNQQGFYMLWKNGYGATRVQAFGLDSAAAVIYSASLERETNDLIDHSVPETELMSRITLTQRFSKQCIAQAARHLNRQSAPFGISHTALSTLVRSINPAQPEAENIRDFLETCKLIQHSITGKVESICCSPEAGDFPIIMAYSGNAIGVLVRLEFGKERDSLKVSVKVEKLANRFARLMSVWNQEMVMEWKTLGITRFTAALTLARMMRRRYAPVLAYSTLTEFKKLMDDLVFCPLPACVKGHFISYMSAATIQELEQEISSLAQLASDQQLSPGLRKTKWPAAMTYLVANSALKSLYLTGEYALDCLLVVGWLNQDTELYHQIKRRTSDEVYNKALETAARLHTLHKALSSPATELPSEDLMQALSVYGSPVNSLTALVASKPGRFLGSSDDFDPSVLDRWLVQVVTRLLLYITATGSSEVPKCCQGLLKINQSWAVVAILEIMPRPSAALEYLRGLGFANLGMDIKAKEAFCSGAGLLNRNDVAQFALAPWRGAGQESSPSDSALTKYSKLVIRGIPAPSLKASVAISTFYPGPQDHKEEYPAWTSLFLVLVKLRRHMDVFAMLVHYQDANLSECVEIWVKELLQEGSISALYLLPLHAEILAAAFQALEQMVLLEPFDLLTTLCSPRYKDQTAAIFLSAFGPDARRPEHTGALTAHMALYTLALGCLNYREAAKTMFHSYQNIEEFMRTAAYQDRERWFLLFLQRESLLLAVTPLNCMPEREAWFIAERDGLRRLVAKEEVLRQLCRIKRELDKIR